MGMEAVKDAAVTYQGSVSAAVTKKEQRPKTVSAEKLPVAEDTVKSTIASDELKADGIDKGNVQQQAQNKQNVHLQKALEEINKKMRHNSEAVFGIHEETNRVTIKIVDKESKKVLKEIPPEETLDMIAKVWELAGIMVDTKM